MWTQNYTPLGNLAVSALVAAVPILFFLLGLTVLKLKGTTAAAISVVLALLVATIAFGMPVGKALSAAAYGVLSGLWPIVWIILMAVWLYKLAVASGKFDVIRSSISSVSPDQRIQVLLIALCFGGFLEGAAGFGVPIAICAALLVELGFQPLKAAMLCLVANAAAGAYGAIGIPVIAGAQQGGVDLGELSAMMVVVLQLATLFLPTLLIGILDGIRGIRQMWPLLLGLGVAFSGTQSLVLLILGPELADIIPGLAGMVFVAVFTRFWQPKTIYREGNTSLPVREAHTRSQVLAAWSPFYILTALILVWSLPAFKALFVAANAKTGVAAGPLNWLIVNLHMPGLDQQVSRGVEIAAGAPLPAVWSWTAVNATGTAIFISVLLTYAVTSNLHAADLLRELRSAVHDLWRPVTLILLVMAVAYLANFSGGSTTIGLALAAVGAIFPLLSPIIGWFGVFITGSVVNNNNLFANLQAVTAHQIGVDPTLLVAANTSGGVMAKVVSPQSIAIAAGAVGLTGRESDIVRSALKYSLFLLAYVCIWTFVLAQVTN